MFPVFAVLGGDPFKHEFLPITLAIEFPNADAMVADKKRLEAIRKTFLDLIAKGMKEAQAEDARNAERLLMSPWRRAARRAARFPE